MAISVLTHEQTTNLLSSGVPANEIPIVEDLVRLLLPQSRYIDVFEEAMHKYKEIKRKERVEAAKKQKETAIVKARSNAIARHGYIESMANGKIYSDKAAYLADVRAMGYIDVGNEDMFKFAAQQKKERDAKFEKLQDLDIEKTLAKIIN